jgi:hypothetical protein
MLRLLLATALTPEPSSSTTRREKPLPKEKPLPLRSAGRVTLHSRVSETATALALWGSRKLQPASLRGATAAPAALPALLSSCTARLAEPPLSQLWLRVMERERLEPALALTGRPAEPAPSRLSCREGICREKASWPRPPSSTEAAEGGAGPAPPLAAQSAPAARISLAAAA